MSLSDDTDTADLRLAQLRRMITWYLRRTATADIAITPVAPRFSEVFDTLTRTAGFTTVRAAQDWFETEHDTVLAALSISNRHRWEHLTIQLAEGLGTLLRIGYQASELVWSQRLGLAAATRVGNPLAAVFATRTAIGLSHLGEHDQAITVADDAVTRAHAVDVPAITSIALSARGQAHLHSGQPALANPDIVAALTVALVHDDTAAAALQHRLLGQLYLAPGALRDTDAAVSSLRTAVRMMADAGDRAGQARAMTYLAEAFTAHGQPAAALGMLTDAAEVRTQPRSARYTAHTERVAAYAHHLLGSVQQAIEHGTAAFAATTTATDASADHDRTVTTTLLSTIISSTWLAPALCERCPNTGKVTALLAGDEADWPIERRWIAEKLSLAMPEFARVVQAQQAFRARAVDYALSIGVDQFVEIGCGFPGPGSIHAQIADHPTARVVYADWEIQAYVTTTLTTTGNPHVRVVHGDFLAPESILAHPRTVAFLDLDRPVCLVLAGLLDHCPPDTDLPSVLDRYCAWLAPGSVVVLSHLTLDGLDLTDPEQLRVLRQLLAVQESYQDTQFPIHFRARKDIAQIVDELDLADPGITWTTSWPATEAGPDAAAPVCFAVVGKVSPQ